MTGIWVALLQPAIGTALVLAAIAKALSRVSITPFLVALGLPRGLSEIASRAVPVAEAVIGLALILDVVPAAASIGAAALSVGFVAALALARTKGVREGCHCFGALDVEEQTPLTVARAALMLLGALGLSLAHSHAALGVVGDHWSRYPAWAGLGVAAGAAAVLAFALLEQVRSFDAQRPRALLSPGQGRLGPVPPQMGASGD